MDKYNKLDFLGKGAYGEAFLCERKTDQDKFVLKTIDPTALAPEDQADAYREVQVLQKLNHPNIVRFEDTFKDGVNICIVMEYCESGDLHNRVVNGEKLSTAQTWEWFVQISKGLEYMHGRKCVHRDLTPKNIFISRDNTLRIGDFGLAKAYTSSVYLMKSKAHIGAIGFNSPEMVQDGKYTDKCDVWALGCILYFMMTSKVPFEAGSLVAIGMKIAQGQYPAIADTEDAGLRDTVEWLLNTDPVERPNIGQVLSNDRLKHVVAPTQRLKSVYGYSWSVTDDKLLDNSGQRYKWECHGSKRDNATRYEGIAGMLTDVLHERMLQLKLKKYPVPVGPREDPDYDNPGTVIFATPNWKVCEALIILISGSGKVMAGQWARKRMMYSDSVESGTQLPYIRRALQCGYGVIVLNTNDNKPDVEGCLTDADHGLYVWEHYVMEAAAVKVVVKSHSDGGKVIRAIYSKFGDHFRKTVYANAFTGDSSVPMPLNDYTRKVTRSWIKSDKPLGTVLSAAGELESVSAGTPEHSYTPHNALPKVFEFIAERMQDTSPGNM